MHAQQRYILFLIHRPHRRLPDSFTSQNTIHVHFYTGMSRFLTEYCYGSFWKHSRNLAVSWLELIYILPAQNCPVAKLCILDSSSHACHAVAVCVKWSFQLLTIDNLSPNTGIFFLVWVNLTAAATYSEWPSRINNYIKVCVFPNLSNFCGPSTCI